MSRKELKFLANSKSHLKMTKYPQKFLVYFSRLYLLALNFSSGRVKKPTDKPFVAYASGAGKMPTPQENLLQHFRFAMLRQN
jgi:hypothetical protein